MLAKRIIPCLDIKDGQTVKGINFVNIQSVGDPVELGALYAEQGADELVFLDITATHEGRKTFVELVKRIARELNIPFTVGGGISEIKDAEALLSAGADKVSINSSAVRNPQLINDLALNFGTQFVVVAIDAKNYKGHWTVTVNGGRIPTDKELFSWAKEAEDRGAGEILFTSMDHDGTKGGFANEELGRMAEMLKIPIIASGGAGNMDHFVDVFTKGKADAGLAASIFHYKEIGIPDLKDYLRTKKIAIR
ncbi:imidazole glycerol phosphate synthase subunit HisF [uncultured Sunxiuqinia sp.]|uniref:imidazole glycerol phosphate synthase subunit HisF n=1 Tax=uncultured Sunxiuqinia sp. TaxID=1573825 RepID=UPI002AA78743|nr:imidazole glycerol phosphate synthase subunit HisF [uncultured Sunxiuqinia sp.]